VFREAMRGIVPDSIIGRTDKIGFAVPVRSWLPAIPGVIDWLQLAAELPPIDATFLVPHVAMLRMGRELPPASSYLMWRLAVFAAWARRFDVLLD
jgi:asparagine synthase (glutamine-hydrolysing)